MTVTSGQTRAVPILATLKHKLTYDVIRNGELSVLQMAKAAGYNKCNLGPLRWILALYLTVIFLPGCVC